MKHYTGTIDSPCGPLRFLVDEDGRLTHLEFLDTLDGPGAVEDFEAAGDEILQQPGHTFEVESELKEYFAGDRMTFEITVAPTGTPFQLKVWEEFLKIPYGETRSYGEIARLVGSPGASRAVGAAAGANPIPVVIPCHRVVGSDGALVGFGGGLENKARLLSLERRHWPIGNGDGEEQLSLDFEP